jgi:RecB family exonuclease
MSLERLIEGPWSFLEPRLLEELGADEGHLPFQQRWIILPDNRLGRHLRRVAGRQLGAIIGIRFLSLEDVAERILADSERGLSPRLGDLARDLIIRGVLRHHAAGIAGLLGEPGILPAAFSDAATKTLNDLREAGITADRVRELAGTYRGRGRQRLFLVADLLETYSSRLDGLAPFDRERLLRSAAEYLKVGGLPPEIRISAYGFYDLTGGQAGLLHGLMEHAPISLYVPLYAETEAYAGTLLESWRSRAAERIAAGPDQGIVRRVLPLPELWEELAGGIGHEPPEASSMADSSATGSIADSSATGSITVSSAPGRGREVDAALRLIAAGWRGGLRAEDTRLASVAVDHYRSLLEQEAESNGFLPAAGDSRPGVGEVAGAGKVGDAHRSPSTTVADGISVVVQLSGREVGWAEIARFLDLVAGNSEQTGVTLPGPGLLAEVGGGGDLRSRISALAEFSDREGEYVAWLAEREADDVAEISVRHQARIERHRARAGSAAAAAEALKRVEPAVSQFPDRAEWGNWAEALKGVALAVLPEALRETIQEVATHLRDLEVTGEPADREAVLWTLRSMSARARPRTSLYLHKIMDLRGVRAPLVVILGVADGSWPGKPAQDPLLLDREREALAGEKDWLLPTARRRVAENRLLFRLVTEAGDRVVFLYPRLDERGSVRRASPHLLELMRARTNSDYEQEDLERDSRVGSRALGTAEPLPAEPLLGELDRDLAAVARAIGRGESEAIHALWGASCFRNGWNAEYARWQDREGTYSGLLKSESARRHALGLLGLEEGGAVSASLLQNYAVCPWRTFLTQVLGLPSEEEESEGRLDPAEMGQLVHDVLFSYVEECRQEDRWPPGPDQFRRDRNRLEAIVTGQVKRAYRVRRSRLPTLQQVDARTVTRRIASWLKWEAAGAPADEVPLAAGAASGWDVLALEQSFTADLTMGARRLGLRGRWDRVDRDHTGRLRVLDYKTGSTRPDDPVDLQGGANLQMPLYLTAARQELADAGEVAGGVLLHIPAGDPDRTPHSVEADAGLVERSTEALESLIDTLLNAIESGVFLRLPNDRRLDSQTGLCRGCPSPTVCRSWNLTESHRLVENPELKPLHIARRIGGVAGESDS